jgi:hypothetical protein
MHYRRQPQSIWLFSNEALDHAYLERPHTALSSSKLILDAYCDEFAQIGNLAVMGGG